MLSFLKCLYCIFFFLVRERGKRLLTYFWFVNQQGRVTIYEQSIQIRHSSQKRVHCRDQVITQAPNMNIQVRDIIEWRMHGPFPEQRLHYHEVKKILKREKVLAYQNTVGKLSKLQKFPLSIQTIID